MQEILLTNIRPHLVLAFRSFGHGGVPTRIATVINKLGARYRDTILAFYGALFDVAFNVT